MRVFFTCSSEGLINNFDIHKDITEYIKKLGHEITYDWIGKAYKEIKNGVTGDTELYYKEKINGINKADVLVVEGSCKSFSVGYQINIALSKSKPVLFLYKKYKKIDDRSQKQYLEGIKSPWLTKRGYLNKEEVFYQVEEFLASYKYDKRYRFNLVLTQEENNLLEKLMNKYHKTKTETIRDLVKKRVKELEVS